MVKQSKENNLNPNIGMNFYKGHTSTSVYVHMLCDIDTCGYDIVYPPEEIIATRDVGEE